MIGNQSLMAYGYILGCVFFTVYGQLVLKWRMAMKGELPETASDKIIFLCKTIIADPFIISGFAAAFLASLFWLAAMTKFELSFAYPFMSLAFVLVLFLSIFLFGEALTIGKVLGVLLIMLGIFVTVRL